MTFTEETAHPTTARHGDRPSRHTGVPAGRADACRRSPARIALFGLFGCGNFGNDGSLEAMLGMLREERPDVELVCICHDPDVVSRKFGIPALPIRWSYPLKGLLHRLNRLCLTIPGRLVDLAFIFGRMRSADLVIIPGTGILDDFGERPHGMPLYIFLWCLVARLLGTRIAFVSIGAGPIHHPLSRWLMLRAARLAQYRSYRDWISKDFLHGLGLDTQDDPVYPDIAFRLPAPPEDRPPELPSSGCVVGVGVMNYRGWYGFAEGGEAIYARYIDKLADFVVYLIDNGHRVRLLMGEGSDQVAMDDLLHKITSLRPEAARTAIFAASCYSLHDLMLQILKCHVVVATRYHNIVCSLKLAKPTISLGYALKNDLVMEEMGLGEFCDHVERFETGELIRKFSQLVGRRNQLERSIGERAQAFSSRLDDQNAKLLVLLPA